MTLTLLSTTLKMQTPQTSHIKCVMPYSVVLLYFIYSVFSKTYPWNIVSHQISYFQMFYNVPKLGSLKITSKFMKCFIQVTVFCYMSVCIIYYILSCVHSMLKNNLSSLKQYHSTVQQIFNVY